MNRLLFLLIFWLIPTITNATFLDTLTFVKSPSNPVLSAYGGGTRFDDGTVTNPQLIQVGSDCYMYYTGMKLVEPICRERGGLAISTGCDLASWTRYDGNKTQSSLMDCSASGYFDYDRAWFALGTVMKDGSDWKNWYPGDSNDAANHNPRIGYATSSDGKDWTKYSTSGHCTNVTEPSACIYEDGSGTDIGALHFKVIKDGDTDYKAWYWRYDSYTNIRYATSTDGINWSYYGVVTTASPVCIFDVYKHTDGNYYLFKLDSSHNIVYSYSTDGITWISGGTLMTKSSSGWDSTDIWSIKFFITGNKAYIFYSAWDSQGSEVSEKIGFASADLPITSGNAILNSGGSPAILGSGGKFITP
jgi:hypothetical protein